MAKEPLAGLPEDYLSAEGSQGSDNSRDSMSVDWEPIEKFAIQRAEWSRAKKCIICKARLSKVLGRRRHHCRVCGNTVCKAHSEGRKMIEGATTAVRICDNCNKDLTNHEFHSSLIQDISQLEAELTASTKHLREQHDEEVRMQRETEKLDKELTCAQNTARDSKATLEARIKDESDRIIKNLEVAETLRGAVSDSDVSSQLIQSKCRKCSSEVQSLSNEIAHLTQQMKELNYRIDRGTRSMQSRIHIAEVTKVMCEDCKTKLYNMSFAESRMGMPGRRKERPGPGIEKKACGEICGLM